MPDKSQWQYIAAAGDLDTLIQRMRENGLARWVGQLPRAPDIQAMENAMRQGITDVVSDVCRWLPGHWRGAKRWMQSGLSILLVQDLLREAECRLPDACPAAMQRIAAQPLETRREALKAAGYAPYMEQNHSLLLEHWLQGFDAACPPVQGSEAHAVKRIKRLLALHRDALLDARRRLSPEDGLQRTDDLTQWQLREQLSDGLRGLLGYETFHAGLLLLYVLLELLQVERCRALLLATAHGWDATGLAQG